MIKPNQPDPTQSCSIKKRWRLWGLGNAIQAVFGQNYYANSLASPLEISNLLTLFPFLPLFSLFPTVRFRPRCGFQLGLEPTIISGAHTPVRTPMRVQTYGFTQRSQPTAQIHGLMDRDRLQSPDLSAPWVKLPPHFLRDPLISVNLTNSKYSDFLIKKVN